jgi:Ca-activated chloride channel family protein
VSFQFQSPWMFTLLLLVPALLYYELRRRTGPSLRFSSTAGADRLPDSWRRRLARLPLALRAAAMVLLVVALARPVSGRDPVRNVTEGVAIQMVLDRSGSMAIGMDYRGQTLPRFEVAKRVFSDFVLGDGRDLRGRPDDLVGVVAFAGFADTISPLTNSREALGGLLKELAIIREASKDGTAIGDGIALGAARLKSAEQEAEAAASAGDAYRIKSKVLILLTDGEQNAGKRSPAQAAALAAQWGIKIYAIGVSSGAGGGFPAAAGEVLQQAAEATGGMFREASDERSLRAVYGEIDRLEKSEVQTLQYLSVRELFPPLALAALALLCLQLLLSATALRRLP